MRVENPVLTSTERFLSTLGALGAVHAHMKIGKQNGVTDAQIAAVFDLVRDEVKGGENTSTFPLGKENTGFAQYFSGKSWLTPLTSNKEPAAFFPLLSLSSEF